jgi:hypothetical protein
MSTEPSNANATHQAIKDTFRSHLIAQANAWVDAGKPDAAPMFLFHYSGHGSQALDESGLEPDGLDETIVPHDSRADNVFDIKDWELGLLIEELTDPFTDQDANVTIILDCCHSGSGTREFKSNLALARRCESDLRPQPTYRLANSVAKTRSVSTSGWMLGTKYVLLAGCHDREVAYEYAAPQGLKGSRNHGALTFFTIQELQKMSPNRMLTYRELHERVRYQVNSRYKTQTPQCEGQKDRYVFGGLAPERDVTLTVIDKSEGLIWVNGGIAHGLTEGSQLNIFPPDTTKINQAQQPIASLYVEEVGAVRSGCIIEEGIDNIQLFSQAVISYIHHTDMQQRIVLDIPDDSLRGEVEILLGSDEVTNYLNVVSIEQPADFRVQLVGEYLELQDSTGRSLVAPFPPDKRHELPDDLIHLTRYRNALGLMNNARHSELSGAIKVEIKGLAFDNNNAPITVPLELNAEGQVEIEVDQRIVVEISNHAEEDLFIAVLNFAYDWSIVQLYPRMQGSHETLSANGGKLSLGLSRKRQEQLAPGLPKEFNEASEFIKVIATRKETDFEILQMSNLKSPIKSRSASRSSKDSPLTIMLEQAANGSPTRSLRTPPTKAEDEWTTTESQFRIVRSPKDKSIA